MKGVHPPNYNRFSDLSLDPPLENKRKKPNKRPQPDLPEVTASSELENLDHLPRYLVATALANDKEIPPKSLGCYNIFQIGRGLDYISKDYGEVTELRNGDLLIKANNLKAAEKFLCAKYIDLVPVKITLHGKLNCSYGKIFYHKIIDYSEEDLINEINVKYPGLVIALRKVKKVENGKLMDTGAAIITFNQLNRPLRLKVGYTMCTVHEHIPNPLKCRNCHKLGHTKNHCKGITLCDKCALPPPHENCVRKFCINCNLDSHASNDPKCPSFLKHKSVNKIKINNRCTVREAWKIFNSNPSTHLIEPNVPKATYSQVVNGTLLPPAPTEHTSKTITTHRNLLSPTSLSIATEQYNTTNKSPETERINTTTKSLETEKTYTTAQSTNPPINKKTKQELSNQKPTATNNIDLPSTSTNTHTPSNHNSNTTSENINNLNNNVTYTGQQNMTTNSQLHTQVDQQTFVDTPMSPTREEAEHQDVELSPCSQAFKKYPNLNVIITPETYRKIATKSSNTKS